MPIIKFVATVVFTSIGDRDNCLLIDYLEMFLIEGTF